MSWYYGQTTQQSDSTCFGYCRHNKVIPMIVRNPAATKHARGQIPIMVVAFFCFLLFAADLAAAETTIGRWCDRMLPNLPGYNQILSIVVADDGRVIGKFEFSDGFSRVVELREDVGGIYSVIGSRSGDKLRIIPTTGELQLLDDDGLIRLAIRLENTPKNGECSY